MKKLILLLTILFCVISCEKPNLIPIEKYGGKKYIIVRSGADGYGNINIQIKNADTIFWINVLEFDVKDLAIGDTIK